MNDELVGLDPSRRASLRQAKLAAVIRSRWATTDLVTPSGVGAPGAALIDVPDPTSGPEGSRGWVMMTPTTSGGLGATLAWGLRHRVGDLHLIVEEGPGTGSGDPTAGILARRATLFATTPQLWQIVGRQLEPIPPALPSQEALAPPDLGPEVADRADLLRAHGVDPVVEQGVLIGEVLGLEVARMVTSDDGPRLEVGVGHHDRQAREQMRPGQSVGAALDEVVAVVRRWRSPGAERHPANLLARERWLRSLVMGRPALVGARWLDPVAPIIPRGDLRRAVPAVAAGQGGDGRAVTVVCSTGVDLDLVPVAADHRLINGAQSRLVIVVPQGDDVRVTRDLVDALIDPAEVVTVPRDWPAALTAVA